MSLAHGGDFDRLRLVPDEPVDEPEPATVPMDPKKIEQLIDLLGPEADVLGRLTAEQWAILDRNIRLDEE